MNDVRNTITNRFLWDVACGPSRRVESWPVYFINGYKFHISDWGRDKATFNSGVCIRTSGSSEVECDFYGVLEEIIQLEYPGWPHKKVVLFKCAWFDPTPNRGIRVHQQYGIVEVRDGRRYGKFDPFILASQADQVYYTHYPTKSRDKTGWLAVLKIKPRRIVHNNVADVEDAYQEELQAGVNRSPIIMDDPIDNLAETGVWEAVEEDMALRDETLGDDDFSDNEESLEGSDDENDFESGDTDSGESEKSNSDELGNSE